MSVIRLGLPSKGRLKVATIDWLNRQNAQIKEATRHREYAASIKNFPEIEIVFLSSAEIPHELASGKIELGITGQDLIRESLPEWSQFCVELKVLDYGQAELVLAVPKFWIDVETIDDFDAVATNFRLKNNFRLRIATKYQNLVRSYLRDMGVADYQLVHSSGATEATIKNHNAEAIADITSSGETLEANHLKAIGDKPILSSRATLFGSRVSSWDKEKASLLCNFLQEITVKTKDLPF